MGDRTIYVGNVAVEINELTLYALFAHCGTVTQVRLAGDPSFNNRFAFVEFADSSMAQTACLLNGLFIAERPLKISMSKTSSTSSSSSSPSPLLAQSNPLLTSSMFSQPALLTRPLAHQSIFGSSLPAPPPKRQDPERVAKTIHIGGVDPQVSGTHLVQYFSVCGPVIGVRISGDSSPRFAWVEFVTREAALSALSLDGQELGNQTLRISPSKTAIQTNALATLIPRTKQQEIASTVQVDGVPIATTEEELQQFFTTNCGKIRRTTLSVDESQISKVAFVEFEAPSSAGLALGLSGIAFRGSALRVTRANNPVQLTTQPLGNSPSTSQVAETARNATMEVSCSVTETPTTEVSKNSNSKSVPSSNPGPKSSSSSPPSLPDSATNTPGGLNSNQSPNAGTNSQNSQSSQNAQNAQGGGSTPPDRPIRDPGPPSITPVLEGEEVTDVQGNKRTAEDYPQSDKRHRWG